MLRNICFGFVIAGGAVSAVAAEPVSTAGRFYVVAPDGRSQAQDPVKSGAAVGVDQRLSGAGAGDTKSRAPENKPPPATQAPVSSATTIRISGGAAPGKPARDEFAAFRCEQAGFYYTKDGRCVAPAGARRVDGR